MERATPSPGCAEPRRDGPIQTIASLLEQREKEHLQGIDKEYHSHVQWLRCMLLLAKKRVMEADEPVDKPTRQSPKKPRRSVMEAAARAQVKKKVSYFNQLAGTSNNGNSSATTPATIPIRSTTKFSRPAIPTTVGPASSSASNGSPDVEASTAPTTSSLPSSEAPPATAPIDYPTSDYTSVFGSLNLGGTLAVGSSSSSISINNIARAATPIVADEVPTQLGPSGSEGVKGGTQMMEVQPQPQQQQQMLVCQHLVEDFKKLTVKEEEGEDEEEEEEEGGQSTSMPAVDREERGGGEADVVDMQVVVEQTRPLADSTAQQEQDGHRDSLEEVLCDFRTGYVKPLTPPGHTDSPQPPPVIISSQPPVPAAAATMSSATTGATAEPEGPEPIIEYNVKKPVPSVAPVAQRPPSAAGEHHHHHSAADSAHAAPGGGAVHFLKSIGLGKIASAFNRAAEGKAHQPIEGFDTVQESYVMSDSDSQEECDEYSDEDDDEDLGGGKSSQKKIPAWARGQVLAAALERQFNVSAGSWVDPDTIFPEVTTCNLEEIFKVRKKRYYKRTSSGNWTQDAIQPFEKLAYKRQLGFDKTSPSNSDIAI